MWPLVFSTFLVRGLWPLKFVQFFVPFHFMLKLRAILTAIVHTLLHSDSMWLRTSCNCNAQGLVMTSRGHGFAAHGLHSRRRGLHSSCTGPAFLLHRACILAAQGLHSSWAQPIHIMKALCSRPGLCSNMLVSCSPIILSKPCAATC